MNNGPRTVATIKNLVRTRWTYSRLTTARNFLMRHLHRESQRSRMRKFLAVVKREYVQRVRTKFFIVATVLGPLFMAGFTILPAMMFGIKSGGPTRLAIVDQTGRMYERVAKELTSGKKQRDEDAVQALDQAPAGNNNAKEKIDQAGALS